MWNKLTRIGKTFRISNKKDSSYSVEGKILATGSLEILVRMQGNWVAVKITEESARYLADWMCKYYPSPRPDVVLKLHKTEE